MRDLMRRIRIWFGTETEEVKDHPLESELRKKADRLRLLRIDAGLPPDRRHRTTPQHPSRRATDWR